MLYEVITYFLRKLQNTHLTTNNIQDLLTMPTTTQPSFEALLSLGLYTVIAVGLVGLLMLLSWGIGQRTRNNFV